MQSTMRWIMVAACSGLFAPALRADVLQQFNVTGSLVTFYSDDPCSSTFYGCPTGSLSGTLTIDTTAGTIVSSALGAVNNGVSYSFGQATTQGVSGVQECDHVNGGCYYDTYFATYNSKKGGASLDLYLDTTETVDGSLTGYTGGTVCNELSECGSDETLYSTMLNVPGSTYFEYVAGADAVATPGAVVTPEPSTFALLGTGALGLAGAVRRRLRRA